jgi:hypothetical protein
MPQNSEDRLPHGWKLLEAICDIEQLINDLENTKKEDFTLNDKDLLCLSLTGLTNEEIAKRMKTSIYTVKTTLNERIHPHIRTLAGGNQKAFISPLLLALICRYLATGIVIYYRLRLFFAVE